MTTIQKLLCAALLVGASVQAQAQRSSELSSDLPDSRTMAIQEKADKLFEAGKYERSFFIHRHELAPLGDKYAQYMVGFMYQSGLGVAEDDVSAAAWFQLSAERGTGEFVTVRDQMLNAMTEAAVAESRALYRELRLQYCDLAVLLSSIKRNVEELENRTSSRVQERGGPIFVTENDLRRYGSASKYYKNLRDELETRLLLLKEVGDFPDIDTDADRIDIRELERRVTQQILAEAP